MLTKRLSLRQTEHQDLPLGPQEQEVRSSATLPLDSLSK